MLLALDAGNTQVVIGCFQGNKLLYQWRISTHPLGTPDELKLKLSLLIKESGLSLNDFQNIILSSVVPSFTWNVEKAFMDKKIHSVSNQTPFSFQVPLLQPESIGADRLVNAEAVICEYRSSAIIIDSGTATTLCALSKNRGYLGGAIIPGLEVSFETLTQKAAKLSAIDLKAPQNAIGKNTKEALQSGVLLGYASMIDGMVERFQSEMLRADESDTEILVIATGGISLMLRDLTRSINVFDSDLTLKGLRLIYEKSFE